MSILDRLNRGEITVSIGVDNHNRTEDQIMAAGELLELAMAGDRMRWIPVTERMPEGGEPVIVAVGKPERYVLKYAAYVPSGIEEIEIGRFGTMFASDFAQGDDYTPEFIPEGWHEIQNLFGDTELLLEVDENVFAWMEPPTLSGREMAR
ncbi:DUF551 domain-containing protein [Acetonema longum]|uniref:DUF551 domain-containing protein n=1 Tax=Acetonema longum DSM 6540 TaxID=1009370 RepID=F7NKB9_9FIRM|nr:DUF551 domain-containing protein [Acetonema longum]EGO63560.1 hypothetical protein ALO_12661 [Acetonema longum DSM 6540]